ncbi:hypothetical protein ACFWZP_01215 [Streptomyces sp. NPDC059013]|uniref:hypothetical protein n=1 Tax=Streptomyces sp. NPDC059013 TaxID=3346697 RepID=UPI0036BC7B8C
MTVRRGQGYTLRVCATPAVHRQLLIRCRPLDGAQGAPAIPAQRKARREYENRVNAIPAPAVLAPASAPSARTTRAPPTTPTTPTRTGNRTTPARARNIRPETGA